LCFFGGRVQNLVLFLPNFKAMECGYFGRFYFYDVGFIVSIALISLPPNPLHQFQLPTVFLCLFAMSSIDKWILTERGAASLFVHHLDLPYICQIIFPTHQHTTRTSAAKGDACLSATSVTRTAKPEVSESATRTCSRETHSIRLEAMSVFIIIAPAGLSPPPPKKIGRGGKKSCQWVVSDQIF